jgi:hypothetical protein
MDPAMRYWELLATVEDLEQARKPILKVRELLSVSSTSGAIIRLLGDRGKDVCLRMAVGPTSVDGYDEVRGHQGLTRHA